MKTGDVVDLIFEKYFGSRKIIVLVSILLGCLLFTYFFINYPLTLGEPHIVVGKRLLFTLDKNFSMCAIQLKEPIEVQEIQLVPDFKQKIMKNILVVEVKSKIDTINVPLPPKNAILDDKFTKIVVDIIYPKHPEARIEKVIIDGKAANLENFFNENLRINDGKLVKQYFIRDYISSFLIYFNDSMSNWLMTFLFFVCIYLFVDMMGYVIICFGPKNKFEKYVFRNCNLISPTDVDQLQGAKISFAQIHSKRDMWYRFFQIFGPAFGFLFTITSLIAGLHPSAQIGRDVSQFFVAIQVAMTSTFIGLFMRIISMWLQILNNKIFDRAELVFQCLAEKNVKEGHL